MSGRGLKDVLLRDLARQWRAAGSTATPTRLSEIVRSLTNNKYVPIVLARVACWQPGRRGWTPLARVASLLDQVLFGVEIALRSDIGPGLYFPHTGGIVLGARAIGKNVTIYHGVTVGAAVLDVAYTPELRPTIGDDVVLAAGAKVLGGVTVGNGAIVGANAVVVDDVPERAVVGGVPARVIKTREGDDQW